MQFTDEQIKEIRYFFNDKIKDCPSCHNHDFDLWNTLDYKQGVRDGIDEMIPFFLLNCNNCGYKMEYLAEKSKLFRFDSNQRKWLWNNDIAEQKKGKILYFKQ